MDQKQKIWYLRIFASQMEEEIKLKLKINEEEKQECTKYSKKILTRD